MTSGTDSFYYLLKKKKIVYGKHDKIDDISQMDKDLKKKLCWLYKGLRIFYRIIGYKNYVLFLQFVRRLSLYDNNTYLLGKEFENYELK